MSLTAAQVIDGALAALGPNGEHWGQGRLMDNYGNLCLVGALCRGSVIERDKAQSMVCQIIHEEYSRSMTIGEWNDSLSDFGPVRAVLEKAKANLEE